MDVEKVGVPCRNTRQARQQGRGGFLDTNADGVEDACGHKPNRPCGSDRLKSAQGTWNGRWGTHCPRGLAPESCRLRPLLGVYVVDQGPDPFRRAL